MDTITPALESLKLKMIFWQSCVIPIEVIRQRIIPKHKIPANQKKRLLKNPYHSSNYGMKQQTGFGKKKV